MTRVDASLFAFPVDFAGAGTDAVLDDVLERAGLREVTIAANYHAARDVFPHNPGCVAYTFDGGSTYVAPRPERYETARLRPRVDPVVESGHDLATLVEHAAARGVAVHAWLNYCHQDITPPVDGTVVRNAFDEIDPGQLCPNNPEVAEYLDSLTADVAAAGPRSIVAEAIHFGTARHGYHHERWFGELDEITTYLLGLCFCTHCREAAARSSLDPDGVAAAVRVRIRAGLQGGAHSRARLDRTGLTEACGPALLDYLDVRVGTVTALALRLAETARTCGSRLVYMDPTGAVRGYTTGDVTGDAGPLPAWQLGSDLAAVARSTGEIACMGYVRDPRVLADVLAATRTAVGPDTRLGVVLRPARPDCTGREELEAKIAAAVDAGVDRIDFYNYAFTPLANLGWIKGALPARGASV